MYIYKVKLVKVIDGDTSDLEVDLGFRTYVEDRFRLYGINTPERGKPGYKEATDFCKQWFANNAGIAYIKSFKPYRDKYGRYLVALYKDDTLTGQSLNDELVQANLAVVYFP